MQELPEDTRHYAMDVTAFKVIVEEISEELHLVPAQVEALRQYLVQVPLIHMDEIITQVNVAPDRSASSTPYMRLQRGGPLDQ
ncbi:hypothetical protein QLQ86_17920 [Halomonas sp. LR5S13]|uniref:hypothetical protein n=1 Tax=Halomonas rhizosphaerae TaxID=3043296 RepID=UPI0024A80B13|nr:hypothetical protein [Halomonas rhizosphaerae]MDI5922657.1 hypothetical protein [Halomonas rhizosphaerae]